jgi:hypothetical protein
MMVFASLYHSPTKHPGRVGLGMALQVQWAATDFGLLNQRLHFLVQAELLGLGLFQQ